MKYKWFPVLPFMLYWIISFILYDFGPFVNTELDLNTYLYLGLCFLLFAAFYRNGLKSSHWNSSTTCESDVTVTFNILRWSSFLTLIGTILLLVDRIQSGSGSLDLVLNRLEDVREYYVNKTTILTAIAVVPQSFRLVAFSSYFYCLKNKILVPKKIHLCMFATISCELYNMILAANRGILFWLTTYWLFYLFFCKQVSVKELLLSKGYFKLRCAFLAIILISLSYFYFVAKNRDDSSYLTQLGTQVSSYSRYSLDYSFFDDKSLGAAYQLFTYGTHEFEYINTFVKNAEIINFDFITPLGPRIEYQITKIFPSYVSSSKETGQQWMKNDGLSIFGWASTFGWSLAFFGFLGSFMFFGTLGFMSGSFVRLYLNSQEFGWFLLVFVMYASLNMSFDWVLKDIEQFVAVIMAIVLIKNARLKRVTLTNASNCYYEGIGID